METLYRHEPISTSEKVRIHNNAEYCIDATHGGWTASNQGDPTRASRLSRKLSRQNLGGPLDLIKVRYGYPVCGTEAGEAPHSGVYRRYQGPILAMPAGGPPLATQTRSQLLGYASADSTPVRWAMGATAISRCKPASPEAELATAFGEVLREGIPNILQELSYSKLAVSLFRDASNSRKVIGKLPTEASKSFLNVEFAWKPFVNDIRKSCEAILEQDRILQDLVRNSDKSIRRRYRFPGETVRTSSGPDAVLPWPTLTVKHWSQSGRVLETTRTKQTWFAGEFRYHVPQDLTKSLKGVRTQARHLLGLELTPEVLWNLAPWSWLGDWFANTGDVLSNVSSISSDNLVMRYGYLMQRVDSLYDTRHYGVVTPRGNVLPTVSGQTQVSHLTRIGASPYGFGLGDADLTKRQVAILGALGMSVRR